MNLGDLKQSKFLKKEDVGPGKLVTISGMTQENVAVEGAEPDMKAVVHFHEFEKGMVLNSTNGQAIARITGKESDIEREWVGARIVLYNDANVSYAGRITGGIRIRAPKAGAILPPAPVAPVVAAGEDGLPF